MGAPPLVPHEFDQHDRASLDEAVETRGTERARARRQSFCVATPPTRSSPTRTPSTPTSSWSAHAGTAPSRARCWEACPRASSVRQLVLWSSFGLRPASRLWRDGHRRRTKGAVMKALIFHGPGQRAWEETPDPTIVDPTDAIVRIDSSTICGTDLHILKGDVPEVTPGTVLGHEAVGTIVEIGDSVTTFEEGDRVLVSCITSCGRCQLLQRGPLRALHRRRRLDLRPPDRRASGRVREGSLRRHLALQGARGAERRPGPLPRRHPADGVRGRRPERRSEARRLGRSRWRRADRPRDDPHGEALHARA